MDEITLTIRVAVPETVTPEDVRAGVQDVLEDGLGMYYRTEDCQVTSVALTEDGAAGNEWTGHHS
jgi:hypothetical protein